MRELTEFALSQEKHLKRKGRTLLPWYFCIFSLIAAIIWMHLSGIQIPNSDNPFSIIKAFLLLDLSIVFALIALILSYKIRRFKLWFFIWLILWFAIGMRISTPKRQLIPTDNDGLTHVILEAISLTIPKDNKYSVTVKIIYAGESLEKMRRDGRIAMLTLSKDETLNYAQRYKTKLKINKPLPPDIQGAFDSALWIKQSGMHLQIQKKAPLIPIKQTKATYFDLLMTQISNHRLKIHDMLNKYSPSGILPALAMGNGSAVETTTKKLFAKLGIAHILAVSGLHFGVIAFFIIFILQKIFERSKWICRKFSKQRASALFMLPTLGLYILFVGAPISAKRAFIMISIAVLAMLLGKKVHNKTSLAWAALCIIILQPYTIFSPAFILSFTAVLGIFATVEYYEKPLRKKLNTCTKNKVLQKILNYILAMLLISIGANIATLPVIITFFNQTPLLGTLANLWVIPWVSFIILPLSLLTVITSIFSENMACLIAKFAALNEQYLLESIKSFDKLPALNLSFTPSQLTIALAIIFAMLLLYRFKISKPRIIALIIFTLLTSTAFTFNKNGIYLHKINNDLKITFIAVGQADATLIQWPDNTTMLVDAGNELRSKFDNGEKKLIPYLRSLGITYIDYLVITHPDYDHYAASSTILEQIPVKQIWYNGHHAKSKTYQNILKLAYNKNIPIIKINSKYPPLHFKNATLTVLWPPPDSIKIDDINTDDTNELSIVLKIEQNDFSALLMGDAGKNVEKYLLNKNNKNITVLKAGHHGSKTSSSYPFIKHTNPLYFIISAGKNNRYKFPHDLAMKNAYQNKTFILQTNQDASIRIITNGKYLESQTRH